MTSVPNSITSSVTSTASNQVSASVDRMRRDNINERIQELLTLIPVDFFQEYYRNTSSNDSSSNLNEGTSGSNTPKLKGTGTKDGKPNKGQILTQAVEYVSYLQNQIDTKNREEVDLIAKIQELSKKKGHIVNDINLDHTSAEEMLAKIGVGPLSEQYESNEASSTPQQIGQQ
ncbi:hypothetical protein Kpol_1032p16, partial [Vanderwaltozyma polyspora DSM 70294]